MPVPEQVDKLWYCVFNYLESGNLFYVYPECITKKKKKTMAQWNLVFCALCKTVIRDDRIPIC